MGMKTMNNKQEEINACPVCGSTPGIEYIGKTVCRVQCPNECMHNRWWLSREQAIERWNMTTKPSKP